MYSAQFTHENTSDTGLRENRFWCRVPIPPPRSISWVNCARQASWGWYCPGSSAKMADFLGLLTAPWLLCPGNGW